MRLHRPHVAKCPRKTPRNRSHRVNFGGTTHGSAARTPRVAKCPTKTSPNRSESGIVSPQTHAPQGERQHNGDLRPREEVRSGILRASEGPKNAFRTAGKPTPSQKWSVRDMPPEKELSIFRFDSKTFRKLFEATSCPPKTPQPKRKNRRNEAFRDFGTRAENGQPRETAELEELIRSPNSQKNLFFVPICPMNTTEKGAKTKLFGNFSDVKKKTKPLLFVAF